LTDDNDNAPRPYTETGGPCTPAWLKMLFGNQDPETRVLTSGYLPPGRTELTLLARSLNTTHWAFTVAIREAPAAHAAAERVSLAIGALNHFFEDRYRSCISSDGKQLQSVEIVEGETELAKRYYDFRLAMQEHKFLLPIDDLLMHPTRLDTWRSIAVEISNAFTMAMSRTNQKPIGISNEGPRVRFVAAVLKKMLGENVTPGNIAKHLKETGAGKQRVPRPARRKTGTI
jgi:hypothetical protein